MQLDHTKCSISHSLQNTHASILSLASRPFHTSALYNTGGPIGDRTRGAPEFSRGAAWFSIASLADRWSSWSPPIRASAVVTVDFNFFLSSSLTFNKLPEASREATWFSMALPSFGCRLIDFSRTHRRRPPPQHFNSLAAHRRSREILELRRPRVLTSRSHVSH